MTTNDMLNSPALDSLVSTAQEKFGATLEFRIALEEAITEMIAAVGGDGAFQVQLNQSLYPYLAAARMLAAEGMPWEDIRVFLLQSRGRK